MANDIIRIGIPIANGTNMYPMVKSKSTEILPLKTIKDDGVEFWNVSFTTLDCTYIETTRHISSDGPLPMDVFRGRKFFDIYRGYVVHLQIDKRKEISLSDIEHCLNMMKKGDALIVNANSYTDKWLSKSGNAIKESDYNTGSPYFSPECMRGIIDAGTAILAGNFPSFSNPNTEAGFGIDMIAEFFKTPSNMILAPLIDLERIEETEVVLQINPINIEGCCGTICSPVIYQGDLKTQFLKYLKS